MADLQYFVVRTDEGELQVLYGRERPAQVPEDADEVELRFIPADWEPLYASDDEESAVERLEEVLRREHDQKLSDQKSGSESRDPE
jgi:hypothetical protein